MSGRKATIALTALAIAVSSFPASVAAKAAGDGTPEDNSTALQRALETNIQSVSDAESVALEFTRYYLAGGKRADASRKRFNLVALAFDTYTLAALGLGWHANNAFVSALGANTTKRVDSVVNPGGEGAYITSVERVSCIASNLQAARAWERSGLTSATAQQRLTKARSELAVAENALRQAQASAAAPGAPSTAADAVISATSEVASAQEELRAATHMVASVPELQSWYDQNLADARAAYMRTYSLFRTAVSQPTLDVTAVPKTAGPPVKLAGADVTGLDVDWLLNRLKMADTSINACAPGGRPPEAVPAGT